jgi:hypothetical protein
MISPEFIDDLKTGLLADVLKAVLEDNTIDMEIRKNFINIYYRGGSLIKISEVGPNTYDLYFDSKYITSANSNITFVHQGVNTTNSNDLQNWISSIPLMKQEMDY